MKRPAVAARAARAGIGSLVRRGAASRIAGVVVAASRIAGVFVAAAMVGVAAAQGAASSQGNAGPLPSFHDPLGGPGAKRPVGGRLQALAWRDDAGRNVELARPAQRVITLAPNLTELVYAVGAGPALVGTVDTSNHPPEARGVRRIGNFERLDVEAILALEPDLVLAWQSGNTSRGLAQLEAAGLRFFYLEPRRLDDVPRALERVGALLGHADEGLKRAAALRAEIAALRASHAGAAPVTVFFQAWAEPLMTLNDHHLVGEVIALCGGRNVFGTLPQLVPQLSAESVLAANPEAMLTAGESSAIGERWQRAPAHPAFARWKAFTGLTAVDRGWLFSIPGDHISRQGPRIVEGVRAMCGALDIVRAERAGRR